MSKHRIRITLEFDGPDSIPGYADLRTAIHWTLADALGEFKRARTPVSSYLADRYPYMAPAGRDLKHEEVLARVKLADLLRCAINEPQAIEERPT